MKLIVFLFTLIILFSCSEEGLVDNEVEKFDKIVKSEVVKIEPIIEEEGYDSVELHEFLDSIFRGRTYLLSTEAYETIIRDLKINNSIGFILSKLNYQPDGIGKTELTFVQEDGEAHVDFGLMESQLYYFKSNNVFSPGFSYGKDMEYTFNRNKEVHFRNKEFDLSYYILNENFIDSIFYSSIAGNYLMYQRKDSIIVDNTPLDLTYSGNMIGGLNGEYFLDENEFGGWYSNEINTQPFTFLDSLQNKVSYDLKIIGDTLEFWNKRTSSMLEDESFQFEIEIDSLNFILIRQKG